MLLFIVTLLQKLAKNTFFVEDHTLEQRERIFYFKVKKQTVVLPRNAFAYPLDLDAMLPERVGIKERLQPIAPGTVGCQWQLFR